MALSSRNRIIVVLAVVLGLLLIFIVPRFTREPADSTPIVFGDREYTSVDAEECAQLATDCRGGWSAFSDATGCGCEKVLTPNMPDIDLGADSPLEDPNDLPAGLDLPPSIPAPSVPPTGGNGQVTPPDYDSPDDSADIGPPPPPPPLF